MKFKEGDIVQHRASGEKGIITKIEKTAYYISFSVDSHKDYNQHWFENMFELTK